MKVVHAGQALPAVFEKSLFLVGPTPRTVATESWRPKFLYELERQGYDGVVFVPEPQGGERWLDYTNQIQWEQDAMNMSDLVLAWVPRQIPQMMGLTTNAEFGTLLRSGKLLYGRPEGAPHTGWLDYMYQKETGKFPLWNEQLMVCEALKLLGKGSLREGGCCKVPLHIWNTTQFQNWLKSQWHQGNQLNDARLLWNFIAPKANVVFAFVLWVKVWVQAENRFKENEFIFSRTDIASVCAYRKMGEDPLDTQIIMVNEFRSPVRNEKSMVYELAGGSAFKGGDPLEWAAHELEEETGLVVDPKRFRLVQARQMNATLSTHHATLFAVELTESEVGEAVIASQLNHSFGIEEDSEKTYIRVRTVREILSDELMDWSMIGMVMEAIR